MTTTIMKNSIKITIPFSFKGEDYTPFFIIDLDRYFHQKHRPEMLAHTVATENNIGNYSYEYEVLHSSEQHFSDATGLAEKYLTETSFDFIAYKLEQDQSQVLDTLQKIAKDTLSIDDLQNHPDLFQALKQALEAGKSNLDGNQ